MTENAAHLYDYKCNLKDILLFIRKRPLLKEFIPDNIILPVTLSATTLLSSASYLGLYSASKATQTLYDIYNKHVIKSTPNIIQERKDKSKIHGYFGFSSEEKIAVLSSPASAEESDNSPKELTDIRKTVLNSKPLDVPTYWNKHPQTDNNVSNFISKFGIATSFTATLTSYSAIYCGKYVMRSVSTFFGSIADSIKNIKLPDFTSALDSGSVDGANGDSTYSNSKKAKRFGDILYNEYGMKVGQVVHKNGSSHVVDNAGNRDQSTGESTYSGGTKYTL